MAQLEDWFAHNLKDSSKNGEGTPQNVIFIFGCWFNQKWRNHRIFSHHIVQRKAFQVQLSAKESFRIPNLVNAPVGYANMEGVSMGCEKPFHNCIKLNTDASVNNVTNQAIVRCLDSNSYGEWIRDFAQNIGCASVLATEFQGILKGLTLCWNEGWRRVDVESNSILVIKLISDNGVVANQLGYLVNAIKRMAS